MARNDYDVVVVGGGHNALVSAGYLARAGLSVLVLERLPRLGGAAVSTEPFAGLPARISSWASLVSLLPVQIGYDLDLDLRLAPRRTSSYTPWIRDGRAGGLLVERPEGTATRESFRELTGSDEAYEAWTRLHDQMDEFARAVSPTLLQPLPRERTLREKVHPEMWNDLVTQPIGLALERRFADDVVRGVVATDALIGTFASLHDPSLVQNRCFLYHHVGNGTGEWRVPVGGMGRVTSALVKAAAGAGADLVTSAEVTAVASDAAGAEVVFTYRGRQRSARCATVLSGVSPWTLAGLMGEQDRIRQRPSGAQLKINLLLERLPQLKSGVPPEVAFAGTLHLDESYTQLQKAYAEASVGTLPTMPPGEVYCHSLTDSTVLEGLAGKPVHTLSYFGLHMHEELFVGPDGGENRAEAVRRVLASIDQHLVDSVGECIALDADQELCLEVKFPSDVENELRMPGGHIFHGDLEWPWVPNRSRLDTPAERWGVDTGHDNVLICGAGARRGGAVSGIGGHNAAQAVLEMR